MKTKTENVTGYLGVYPTEDLLHLLETVPSDTQYVKLRVTKSDNPIEIEDVWEGSLFYGIHESIVILFSQSMKKGNEMIGFLSGLMPLKLNEYFKENKIVKMKNFILDAFDKDMNYNGDI